LSLVVQNLEIMTAIAVLKMPRRMGDKLIKVRSIENMLTNYAFILSYWFSDIVSFTQFDLDIRAFEDAEITVKTRLAGSVGERDAALAIVMKDLQEILYMVQGAANADHTNAVSIIQSAGFGVKNIYLRKKMQTEVFNTEVTGIVLLTADGSRSHEWQMSKDQIEVISLPSTNNAQTYVKDLTPGDVWYFRTRKLNTKKMIYNWSPWKKLFIGSGGRVAKGKSLAGISGSIAAK